MKSGCLEVIYAFLPKSQFLEIIDEGSWLLERSLFLEVIGDGS